MAMITGAVHDRDFAPRQSGELGVQGWLVGLDDQQVVGAAVDEETSVVALGVQRVGGDHHTGKVQAGQQRRKHRDLVGGGGHVPLGDHAAVVVARRCQEMRLVAVTTRAAQPLAVNRDHAAVAWPVQPIGQPRADGDIHRVAVHPCEHPADGRLAGTWQRRVSGSRRTKRGQDRPGRVSGPLGDRGHTPGAGQHRRSANGEHAGQGMPPSPPVTRVGDRRQPFQQARAFARNEQASMVKDGDGSGDGRRSGGRHGGPSGHEETSSAWSRNPVPASHPSGQTTLVGHHGTLTEPWANG
jgi:hypothetical protein